MVIRRGLVGAGVLLGWTPVVLAQVPGQFVNEEASWLVWAVLAGAAAVICATGFMNPKRSHLN